MCTGRANALKLKKPKFFKALHESDQGGAYGMHAPVGKTNPAIFAALTRH
jgi:hypothetical protein